MTKTGLYEIATLTVGAVVSGLSAWQYSPSATHAQNCLEIAGFCVPFLLLLLAFIEAVGILAVGIVSTAQRSYFAAEILPHAAVAIGVTLGLAVFVRLSF